MHGKWTLELLSTDEVMWHLFCSPRRGAHKGTYMTAVVEKARHCSKILYSRSPVRLFRDWPVGFGY